MVKIFNKKSLILIIFISLFVVMSSGMVNAQTNGEAFENLKLPSDVEELVKSFSYMNYDIVMSKDDQKIQDSTLEYDYLGKEEVEGVETDKVSFKMEDSMENDMPSEMSFWFEGTDIKKMIVDGEEISAEMIDVMGDRLLKIIFAPFYSLSEINMEEMSEMGEVSHSQEMFGGEEIDVTTIEIGNIPEYELESVMAKVGEYDEAQFVISYNYVSSEEDMEVNFDVNEIEFH
ncbi:MAG: hypothetical protein R6V14_02525 [Halanaerobiales bacterium]